MAETTQFVSRISVKDLISTFESKSETVKVEYSRPRAKSFGNVLNKDVVVRLNEFITLEDVETGLKKLESNLNFYEVYNKEKHVAFQERFFNILTSIANIENDSEEAPVRKKALISRTQTLVSFLNTKLPSNINQVTEKANTQYKYTPYSSRAKETVRIERSQVDSSKTNIAPAEPSLYVESNAVDVTDSGHEYFVSVKKLKETFQKTVDQTDGLKQQEVTSKATAKQETVSKVTSKQETVTKTTTKQETLSKVSELQEKFSKFTAKQEAIPKVTLKLTPPSTAKEPAKIEVNEEIEEEEEEKDQNEPVLEKAVSVTKLRSLFERRSEENSKGLEIITVEKPLLAKNALGGSAHNITIPFTERNLGNIRLQRSVSGNYMNYSGLLKRVDINRSSSFKDLNKNSYDEISSADESDSDSDETVENQKKTEEVVRQSPSKNEQKENKSIPYRQNNDDEEEDTEDSEEEEEVSSKGEEESFQTFQEQEANYFKASSEEVVVNNNENRVSFIGYNEQEVNSGLAEGKNVPVEENVAKLLSTDNPEDEQEYTKISASDKDAEENDADTSSEIIKTTEDVKVDEIERNDDIKDIAEEEVNGGFAEAENVQIEGHVAKLESTSILENEQQAADNRVEEKNDDADSEVNKTTDDIKTNTTDETEDVEEQEVNSGFAETENVQGEEKVVKLESTSNFDNEQQAVDNHVEEKKDDTNSEVNKKTEDIKTKTTDETEKNVDEQEVNSGFAETENVQLEEKVAKFGSTTNLDDEHQAADNHVEQKNANNNSEDNKTIEDNKTNRTDEIEDVDEQEVNGGLAESENIQVEEGNTTTPEDEAQSIKTSAGEETENNTATNKSKGNDSQVTENGDEDHTDFNSLLDEEEEKQMSLIEQEIEKMDFETLANADITLNPEDLKNADDEFEKLLENNITSKQLAKETT